jgi:hypothetical protein
LGSKIINMFWFWIKLDGSTRQFKLSFFKIWSILLCIYSQIHKRKYTVKQNNIYLILLQNATMFLLYWAIIRPVSIITILTIHLSSNHLCHVRHHRQLFQIYCSGLGQGTYRKRNLTITQHCLNYALTFCNI